MRSIIVNLVRAHRAERRAGGSLQVTLNAKVRGEAQPSDGHPVCINEVPEELDKTEPRQVGYKTVL